MLFLNLRSVDKITSLDGFNQHRQAKLFLASQTKIATQEIENTLMYRLPKLDVC